MYKTVRHGENSLQYKILAQQEEDLTGVKCRRAPRTVTAKLITVIILLIIGIIASAVLVPLVLTNDFIALTGTFQKFSVSTLRRSHSGNHVVVIAKKPYGWNGAHSNLSSRPSNSSRTGGNAFRKSTLAKVAASTVPEPVETTETTKTIPTTPVPERVTLPREGNRQMERTTTESSARSDEAPRLPGTSKPAFDVRGQNGAPGQPRREGDGASSTAEPLWFEPVKKWGFGSSDNFINGMNGMAANPVSILGSFLFVVVVIVMFFILRKTLTKRRTSTEKERAESKEDNARLLRPSSDHDEE